jgi:AraC-like DNA-binding protein
MVCNRCKMVVQSELEKVGLHAVSVSLGEVVLQESELTPEQSGALIKSFEQLGFEIIDDKKSRLIEKIKTLIVELIYQHDSELNTNLSDYLSSQLHHDYSYLSNLFSEVEGTTIEKHFINQKIERVKELLIYDELSLSEIAYQLHYSSVAHLSGQFKKIIGLTPTHFKNIRTVKRKPLDEV